MFGIGSNNLLNAWKLHILEEERYDTDNRVKEKLTGRCTR